MNHTEIKDEINRRKGVTARMLEAFKKHGELTTKEINKFGNGCSSRIHELRKEGHKIVPMHDSGPNWRYIYLGHPDEDSTNVSVID